MQPTFMGVPANKPLTQHAGETISGLINLARMRQNNAREHVARLEQALAAIDHFAQLCLQTRETYIQQIVSDQASIDQFVQFATGQFSAVAVAPPISEAQKSPEYQQAYAASLMAQGSQIQYPIPSEPTQAVLPVRSASSNQRGADSEGRRPVSVITPEMRDQWKQAPPVQVVVAGPGEDGYVASTPTSTVVNIDKTTAASEASNVGSDQRQSEQLSSISQ